MRNPLAAVLAAVLAASTLGLSTGAASAGPIDESCALVDALATGGSPAGLVQLARMARRWNDDDAARLGPMMGPVLGRFDYRGGSVYEIAALGNALVEHLLVMNMQTGGSVYIRLLYEGNGTAPATFVNIDFQSKYYDIMKKPLMKAPAAIACE